MSGEQPREQRPPEQRPPEQRPPEQQPPKQRPPEQQPPEQQTAEQPRDEIGLPERPRRKIPSWRAIAIAAGVLGVADLALIRATQASWTQAILNAVVMAAFVYFGMRAVVKVRLGYRPDAPAHRDPSQPPPPGGWATPTKGQGLVNRLRRLRHDARPPRTPRSRR